MRAVNANIRPPACRPLKTPLSSCPTLVRVLSAKLLPSWLKPTELLSSRTNARSGELSPNGTVPPLHTPLSTHGTALRCVRCVRWWKPCQHPGLHIQHRRHHRTSCCTSTPSPSACSGSPTSFRRTATSPRWDSRGPLTSCHGRAAWPKCPRPDAAYSGLPSLWARDENPRHWDAEERLRQLWCQQRVAHSTAFGHAGRRSSLRSSSSW